MDVKACLCMIDAEHCFSCREDTELAVWPPTDEELLAQWKKLAEEKTK